MINYYSEVVWVHGETQMEDYQTLFESLDSSEMAIYHPQIDSTSYVYRWYIRDLKDSDRSMLMARKLQGDDISIIRREQWEVQHLIDHKRFLESDTTIEDLRKLSGVEDLAISPVIQAEPLEVLGESLVQTGFTKLGYQILSSFDVGEMPDAGFLLDFNDLSQEELAERIDFLKAMDCKVAETRYYQYRKSGIVIVEELSKQTQLRFKLKFGDPAFIRWFYNDYIESLKRNAGVT